MKSIEDEIILDFESKFTQFKNFSEKMNILLKELLEQNDITYNSIAKRVKDKSSLVKKIRNKNKYQNLDEITDVIGCRIITYFEDDVDKIVKIIANEFQIDEKNSTDKKKILDPDKFGYLSYHIVCSLSDDRAQLVEYKNYKNIKFEIQIRTILQHAWAEIEHDIGYKSSIEVPRDFRRKFSRIAGMLEIADDEFSRLKNDISDYVKEIEEKGVEDTDINAESLKIFIEKSEKIESIEKFLIKNIHSRVIELSEYEKVNAINLVLILINKFTKLKKIKELENAIMQDKHVLEEFIVLWINSSPKNVTAYYGLVVLYFILVHNIQAKNIESVETLFNILREKPTDIKKTIELAFNTYEKIIKD